MIFSLPNLSSAQVKQLTIQELLDRPPAPPDFASKSDYRDWCILDSTDHTFFSMVEGLNPHIRVGKENPAVKQHGLVIDYDADDEIEKGLKRVASDWPISYVSRTFSGNIRALVIFEDPIPIVDAAVHTKFLKAIGRHARLSKLWSGLDESSFSTTEYFELGRDWQKVSDEVVSSAVVRQAHWETVKGSARTFSSDAIRVDLGDVAEEIEQRWPGIWKGKVEVGARGSRYWVPGATDPTAAVVTPNGMIYFTDGGGFASWSDIFGSAWVRKQQSEREGDVISDIYLCGARYFWPDPNNPSRWVSEGSETRVKRFLETRGLSRKVRKGEERSEVEDALASIETVNRLGHSAPYHFDPRRVFIDDRGRRVLNTSTIKVLPPSSYEKCGWGENFSWTSSWIDDLIPDKLQRDFLISWLSAFYRTALGGKPCLGHTLFLAGGHNVGKTLFSNRLVGGLMGGFSNVGSWMTGKEKYNKNLFDSAVACVDDEGALADNQAKKSWTNQIKQMAANPVKEYRAMYQDPAEVVWKGRLIVSCNDDPESIQILPDLSDNFEDKILVLKCTKSLKQQIPYDVEEVITNELPFFAQFLVNWEVPAEVQGSSRFGGVASFIDPGLRQLAVENGTNASARDLLEAWVEEKLQVSSSGEWFTTAEIHRGVVDLFPAASRTLSYRQCRVLLNQMNNEQGGIVVGFRRRKGAKEFKLNRMIE